MDDGTFYATVAQVLPLFVLALAAERRLGVRDRSSEPAMDAILGIGLITAAAIGEFAAFDALAGHPTHSNRVAAELGTGFAGLFLYGDLVWSQVRGYTSHNPKAWHRRVLTAGAVTLIGMGALLLTLFWLSVLG